MPVKPAKPTARELQVEARREKVASMIPRMPMVRVVPRDDRIRKSIVHPVGSVKFPQTGSVEWPLDQFTQRRLRDGDVMLVAGSERSFTDQQTGVVQEVSKFAAVEESGGRPAIPEYEAEQRRAAEQRAREQREARQAAPRAPQQPRSPQPQRPAQAPPSPGPSSQTPSSTPVHTPPKREP